MADVFLSYAREDREQAEKIAALLEQSGWSVWWDRQIQPRSGETFDSIIDKELGRSRCALILWSHHSIGSTWVKAEAIEALEAEKLVQARLDEVKPPLPFRAFHCASLVGWNGRSDHAEFAAVRAAIEYYAPGESVLSAAEATVAIANTSAARRTKVGDVEQAPESVGGTKAYRARARDGKGVIYFHASGPLRGQAFYVRKGIGYFYEHALGGSTSPLGLPVSNEELVDGEGFPTSYFENGFIDWSPETSIARAVVKTPDGETELCTMRL